MPCFTVAEVASYIEADIEGNEECSCDGGVIGEAVIRLHAVADEDVDGELVGVVAVGVGEDSVDKED